MITYMTKPVEECMFREIEGIWTDVKGKGGVLADYLSNHDLIVDDKTQFARIYDYEKGVVYWYRAHAGLVTITVWRID